MTKLAITTACAVVLATAACTADETLSGFTDPDAVWTLTELNGEAFDGRATIQFPEAGRIAGQAPCNRFSGTVTVPYPWFATGPLAATRMACPDLDAESTFFAALGDMTESEVSGPVLILRNSDTGQEMVFENRQS